MDNIILDTDSYKSGHYLQYPPGTTRLVAYLESRGGVYNETLFFGLQYIIKRYLTQKVNVKHVKEAQAFFKHHKLPFNTVGWMYIATKLKGKIPLRIDAVPEGSVIPTHNVLLRVESTDPKCFWVTGWFETMLLRVWYPITVATQSWHLRQLILRFLEKTADAPEEEVSFKLHDFGARGVSSQESAMIGGAAHLVSFSGSDTIAGMVCANTYYGAKLTPSSIPAAEHSSIMTWGQQKEEQAFATIFTTLSKLSPIVALPADTYDTWNAIDNLWGKQIQHRVLDAKSMLVVRTDSGHPPTVVLKALQKLEKAYGAEKNTKGYKVLRHVRVLHSDGLNAKVIQKILEVLLMHGYSTSNIVFGMGGSLLQNMTRDTQMFAYKICLATIGGKDVPVAKSPKTDAVKQSKEGYLDLVKTTKEYKTVVRDSGSKAGMTKSELRTVFKNGTLLIDDTFTTIRNRAGSP